jgi:hypothetical protein
VGLTKAKRLLVARGDDPSSQVAVIDEYDARGLKGVTE